MLEKWLMPQLNEDSNDYIFQQDGSPAHYKDMRRYLNRNLPQKWIGRTGKEDYALMRWPPRSPDLIPCNFFFWGVCEGHILCASTPRLCPDFRNCITTAVALVDCDMLTHVWNKMDYCKDVCRITKGGHIEHLRNM